MDAVNAAVEAAAARARAGDGPSLLEMKTYRYAGHSRSDTAPYRPAGEFDKWYERDPVNTFGARLTAEGLLAPGDTDAIAARIAGEVDAAVDEVKTAAAPGVASMFENVLV